MTDESKIDRHQLHTAVRQVLFNELFPAAKDGGKGHGAWTSTWRDWIKAEMREAVRDMMRGTDKASLIEGIVLQEVRNAVRELPWARDNVAFKAMIRDEAKKLATALARQMIEESMRIDINLSGSISQPAKGQRHLDTED